MNLNLLVHYNQELGVTESRDWSIKFCHVVADWRLWRQTQRALKQGILCCRNGRKKLKEKELKHSGCHLPVRLGNHNEENGSWEVFLLIMQEDGYIDLYAMH